jgi:hypothetical protein
VDCTALFPRRQNPSDRFFETKLYREMKHIPHLTHTGLKKCIYSTCSPLISTHLWLRCSNFFNPSKKNSFGCAENRKSQKTYQHPYVHFKTCSFSNQQRPSVHYCNYDKKTKTKEGLCSFSVVLKSDMFYSSIGFWRWCITHKITGFSDFVHRPDSNN